MKVQKTYDAHECVTSLKVECLMSVTELSLRMVEDIDSEERYRTSSKQGVLGNGGQQSRLRR